ncbi:hypothetical protein KR009_009578 [Drosophila setifemur]|nr:hypothetical protein KR009_009578 [Drosophila setifemur]
MELFRFGKRFGVLLLEIVLLLPQVQLQHHLYYHPRQLYYDSPRLRRFEYAAVTPYLGGGPAAVPPPPAGHYQQQTPHFQLINYRPGYQPLPLDYQHQQPPVAPAPPLPPLYPQQSVQYQQRVLSPPAELAKYRYEGNYLPVQRISSGHQQQQQLRRVEEQQQPQQLYNVPPALFTSDVLHVIPPRIARLQEQQQQPSQTIQTERPRRNADKQDAEVAESRSRGSGKTKETKYFHDILMRFDGPNNQSHGHVMKTPKAQERRFESQRGTNRYKGEVIWTDRKGGRGEHRWDMAQGKL